MNDEKNIQNVEKSEDSIVNSIANSEARGEESNVKGATQGAADFTSMFGVASEETAEQKQMSKHYNNPDIPRVLEVKDEEREVAVQISPEEKKANHKKNFNSDERLIYQIEEEKQGNPVVVVLFFMVLVAFLIILPRISKKIDLSSFFKTETSGKNGEEEQEEEFFRIESSRTRAKIGDLEMINFSRSKENGIYTLSFTIQNYGSKIYLFDKKWNTNSRCSKCNLNN